MIEEYIQKQKDAFQLHNLLMKFLKKNHQAYTQLAGKNNALPNVS